MHSEQKSISGDVCVKVCILMRCMLTLIFHAARRLSSSSSTTTTLHARRDAYALEAEKATLSWVQRSHFQSLRKCDRRLATSCAASRRTITLLLMLLLLFFFFFCRLPCPRRKSSPFFFCFVSLSLSLSFFLSSSLRCNSIWPHFLSLLTY